MAEALLKRKPAGNVTDMEDERLEVLDRAYTLCKEYLRGPWAAIPKSNFQLTVLGGGLTNKLYICEIPKEHFDPADSSPRKVLLRIYGLIIQDFPAQIQESVVFSILSERKIGPHLYAVFPGGRLEEYLPCRTLSTNDLSDPFLSQHIAKQLANYHKLVMPVNKEPTCIMNKLQLYFEGMQHVEFEDEHKTALLKKLRQFNLKDELHFIKRLVEDTASPVVFCHNDVQEGNLLHMNNDEKPVLMIDFEYSSYNYRGFDIGNHFCERMYNYTHPKYPFYSYKFEDYPDKHQQTNFIESYIKEHFSTMTTQNSCTEDEKWQVDFMRKEANRFALVSHLFWAMWSVVQAKMSDIRFGYLEYALVRMDSYFRHKAEIQ